MPCKGGCDPHPQTLSQRASAERKDDDDGERPDETKANAEVGQFLRLDVWSTRGFNVQKVKEGGMYRWCSVFGDTYAVGTHSWSHEKKQQMIQDEMLKLPERGRK